MTNRLWVLFIFGRTWETNLPNRTGTIWKLCHFVIGATTLQCSEPRPLFPCTQLHRDCHGLIYLPATPYNSLLCFCSFPILIRFTVWTAGCTVDKVFSPIYNEKFININEMNSSPNIIDIVGWKSEVEQKLFEYRKQKFQLYFSHKKYINTRVAAEKYYIISDSFPRRFWKC